MHSYLSFYNLLLFFSSLLLLTSSPIFWSWLNFLSNSLDSWLDFMEDFLKISLDCSGILVLDVSILWSEVANVILYTLNFSPFLHFYWRKLRVVWSLTILGTLSRVIRSPFLTPCKEIVSERLTLLPRYTINGIKDSFSYKVFSNPFLSFRTISV